jgi:molecular chaperone DnaK (HSP70)
MGSLSEHSPERTSPPSVHPSPPTDEAVAFGAAVQGAMLASHDTPHGRNRHRGGGGGWGGGGGGGESTGIEDAVPIEEIELINVTPLSHGVEVARAGRDGRVCRAS